MSDGQAHIGPVRLRVSLAGWLFILVAVILGAASMKSQVALMYILFGGMLGAVLASAAMSRRMIRHVAISRDLPDRVWQNQTVHLGYFLRNLSRRRSCLGIEVSEISPEGITSASGYCLHLPAGAVFRSGARFAARRRGRVRLKGIRISTSFPFGLVLAGRRIRRQTELVVWPAKGALKRQLLIRGAVETSSAAPSPATGGQDEFFGLREYRPGDNPRWIAWRKSATRRTPVVREMSRPLPEILWVVLDSFCDGSAGAAGLERREQMIRFAATLIDHAFARGYQVGLATATRKETVIRRASSGRGQRAELLDALADIDHNDRRGMAEVIAQIPRGAPRQAQVVLIAGPQALTDRQALAALRGSCRHLSVIAPADLAEVFEDDPLVKEAT